MILLVGTRSRGKQREVRRLLAGTGIEVRFPDDVGVFEEPAEDALELADSYETNARAKAEYFSRRTGLPTVADDSGLEVIALGGAPGVRSKRWAGAQGPGAAVDAANNAELLRRLAGAPAERRRARFRCVLAYFPRPNAAPEIFEGICPGSILDAPRGTDGFGYDPLFLSDALGKTLAEATDDEKDRVSHRGIAFRAFRERLAAGQP
ncbi:MAG TPA: non-canonical purine NTP pyrophosphatase [Gemmatimonadales bacterium]|nr:non-canonical purine NTP pyrophosphatase [Gemmatimonadales bacterium]